MQVETGFLRRYVADYAKISQPITDLLKGYSNKKTSRKSNKQLEVQQFKWGCEQQAAFELLKKKISEDVVLAYPDLKKPFRLCCDASRNGLGASLEIQGKIYSSLIMLIVRFLFT